MQNWEYIILNSLDLEKRMLKVIQGSALRMTCLYFACKNGS